MVAGFMVKACGDVMVNVMEGTCRRAVNVARNGRSGSIHVFPPSEQ